MEQAINVPDPEVLRDFWTVQRSRAHLSEMESYLGASVLGAIVPPAWAWGNTRAEADAFVEEVLGLGDFVLRTPLSEFGDEELPAQGTASILCDGAGTPIALVSIVAVSVVESDEPLVEEHHRVITSSR